MGRDFSCAICTADNRLLSSAEGLPVHIFGIHLQTAAMCDLHPDLAEGDAFLHNDPYLGNSHPADHTILVPVFVEGMHLFTVCAKAHQADIGNSLPTTYHAAARDVYEEGALIFPCVRVQRDRRDIEDVIRMCRARIRVPEQWYGDYLAALGAARIGERRLTELVARCGRDTIAGFIEDWFDYAERRMEGAIRRLPSARLRREGRHDPMPPHLPDGIPLAVSIEIDPAAGRITVDLTDNPDCVDCGLNQSEATATNNAINGVFNSVEHDIPHNAGSLRRIDVRLRENCVAGIPRFPHSCSMATTNVAHWLVNLTQSAFAHLGDGYGLAEGGGAMSAAIAVVSGRDPRRGEARYVNQLILGVNGGPASARSDGWVMYGLPVVAGLMYRDSIELDELKHPMRVRSLRLVPDSGGAGRQRGAPGCEIVYGPTHDAMTGGGALRHAAQSAARRKRRPRWSGGRDLEDSCRRPRGASARLRDGDPAAWRVDTRPRQWRWRLWRSAHTRPESHPSRHPGRLDQRGIGTSDLRLRAGKPDLATCCAGRVGQSRRCRPIPCSGRHRRPQQRSHGSPLPTKSSVISKALISRRRDSDGDCALPPAQIQACAADAPGSHLGFMTSNRQSGQGCRSFGLGNQRPAIRIIL